MSTASRALSLSRRASRTALTHLKTAHAQAGLSASVRKQLERQMQLLESAIAQAFTTQFEINAPEKKEAA
jgi:hypothetical protein